MKTNNTKKYYYLYEIVVENPESSFFGKRYYGMHCTDDLDDDYYGSGFFIHQYVNKYGKTGLKRNILAFYNNQDELAEAEKRLVEEKQRELGNHCLNLNEGGYGSFSAANAVLAADPELKHRCALAGGIGNKKRLENSSLRASFVEKCKNVHASRTEDEKQKIYSKASEGMKKWYADPTNKAHWDDRRQKNAETNRATSAQWRPIFQSLFEHTPEFYRTYGKMKDALKLFHTRQLYSDDDLMRYINELNAFCIPDHVVQISESTRKLCSDIQTKRHKKDREKRCPFIYVIDGQTFLARYDFLKYVNDTYSGEYDAKLTNNTVKYMELGQSCSSNTPRAAKRMYEDIFKKTTVTRKGTRNQE